jgi:hypothetical protein
MGIREGPANHQNFGREKCLSWVTSGRTTEPLAVVAADRIADPKSGLTKAGFPGITVSTPPCAPCRCRTVSRRVSEGGLRRHRKGDETPYKEHIPCFCAGEGVSTKKSSWTSWSRLPVAAWGGMGELARPVVWRERSVFAKSL